MAKLADAQDLGSCPERGGGSTPSRRNFNCKIANCKQVYFRVKVTDNIVQ